MVSIVGDDARSSPERRVLLRRGRFLDSVLAMMSILIMESVVEEEKENFGFVRSIYGGKACLLDN